MQYIFEQLQDFQEQPISVATPINVFPEELLSFLKNSGVLQVTLPKYYKGNELSQPKHLKILLEVLSGVGKIDLSMGRIYEGHVNALLLIDLYGTEQQKEYYFTQAANNKIFGVWNTEWPHEALSLVSTHDSGKQLQGCKVFCSGGSMLDYPIVSICKENAHQLLIVDNSTRVLEDDFSTWNPIGMKHSLSCRIDFTGIEIQEEELLGVENCYFKEPHFVGGSVRFAAVQLGGAQHLAELTLKNLKKRKRFDDPYQQERMAKVTILLESGRNWLHSGAERYQENYSKAPQTYAAYACMVRTAVMDVCYEVMNLCERSLGVIGFTAHPEFSKTYQDLLVYLKQPAPDLSLNKVAQHIQKKNSITDVR